MKNLAPVSFFMRILALLNNKERKGVTWVIAGILLNSVLEILGLAAILPLVTVALKPELIESNEILQSLYQFSGASNHDSFLLMLMACVFGMFLVKNLYGLFIAYFQLNFSMKIATNLSRKMYDSYLRAGYTVLRTIDRGDFITNIRSVPSFFGQSLLVPCLNVMTEIVVITIILVSIAIFDLKILVSLGIFVGVGFFLIFYLTKRRTNELGKEKKAMAPRTIKSLTESLSGYVDSFIFQGEKFFQDRFLSYKQRENNIISRFLLLKTIPAKLSEIVAVAGMLFIFVYAVFWSEDRENLLIMLTLFAAAAYRIMPSMNRILMHLVSIRSHVYTLDILESADLKEEIIVDHKKFGALSLDQSIELKNFGFKFQDSEENIFDEFNLSIKKGEQLGIIGKSGSGKTTLIRIILRLLKEQEGDIIIDGNVLNMGNQDSWISKLGFVQQKVFIMDGSLRENIAFGQAVDEVDHERVNEAVELASLNDLVDSLPAGLDTHVGEEGAKLSGGQRQRLAIARALYKNAELFILDEATSALDPKTEQYIIQSVNKLKELGKTVILIAHRFSTLRSCDRIIELKKGKIVGEYTFEELQKIESQLIEESKYSPANG